MWRVTFSKKVFTIKKNWDEPGFHARDDIPRAHRDETEFRSNFSNTYKYNGDIITDTDTMNRHTSECILIKVFYVITCFTTHVKTIVFSREAKFENFVRGFMARQDYFTCFEQSRTLCGIKSGDH